METTKKQTTNKSNNSQLQKTVPTLYDRAKSAERVKKLSLNYDDMEQFDNHQHSVDVLISHLHAEPFLLESRFVFLLDDDISFVMEIKRVFKLTISLNKDNVKANLTVKSSFKTKNDDGDPVNIPIEPVKIFRIIKKYILEEKKVSCEVDFICFVGLLCYYNGDLNKLQINDLSEGDNKRSIKVKNLSPVIKTQDLIDEMIDFLSVNEKNLEPVLQGSLLSSLHFLAKKSNTELALGIEKILVDKYQLIPQRDFLPVKLPV
jgi:hypothetical protein